MNNRADWLSADWGTTNFRLRLVESGSLRILAELTHPLGVAAIFNQWKSEKPADSPESRISFYLDFLKTRIGELESQTGSRLEGRPVILSGMAGSTIGMKTVPYQRLPCPTDGTGLEVWQPEPTPSFPFRLALVGGVSSANDVMRGEETMLVGAVSMGKTPVPDWYLFPGTHSKHLRVAENRLTGLRTYMTGELFALLAEKSILSASVEQSAAGSEPAAFSAGLREGWSGKLAQSVFHVRTADILDGKSCAANYHFLSGMLIGHELSGLEGAGRVSLVGEGALLIAYQTAIRELMPSADIRIAEAAVALVRGQSIIAEKIFHQHA